jgi:hypothetical protein
LHTGQGLTRRLKVVVKKLLDQRVYDLAAAAAKEVCAGNAAALAVRTTSDNGMAATGACRQLELMRQTVAEETGGPRQSVPGLVVIIENRDGSVRTIAPPMPAPMIEHALPRTAARARAAGAVNERSAVEGGSRGGDVRAATVSARHIKGRSFASRPKRRCRAARGWSRDVRQGARIVTVAITKKSPRASALAPAPKIRPQGIKAADPSSQGDHRWRKPPARCRPR